MPGYLFLDGAVALIVVVWASFVAVKLLRSIRPEDQQAVKMAGNEAEASDKPGKP